MSDLPYEIPSFMRNHNALGERYGELISEIQLMTRALRMFETLAFRRTSFPDETTFPNDLGGSVCMARASRQLNAAFVLATHGFHAEVRYMIRGAYESAGLGRCLAKNSDHDVATKWIEKGTWFPDGKVRTWLGESGVIGEDQVGDYRSFYRLASSYAHPTRQSCFDQLKRVDGGLELISEPEFDLEVTRHSFTEITFAALFACFAFQNGVSDVTIIPPDWRREVQAIAQELTGEDYAHLERNWDEEAERYQEFVARVQSMGKLHDTLAENPTSTQNLTRPDPSGGDQKATL